VYVFYNNIIKLIRNNNMMLLKCTKILQSYYIIIDILRYYASVHYTSLTITCPAVISTAKSSNGTI